MLRYVGLKSFALLIYTAVWMQATNLIISLLGEKIRAPFNLFLGTFVASALVLGTILSKSLVLLDLCGIVLVIQLLVVLRLIKFASICLLCLVLFLHDAIHVFGTGLMQATAERALSGNLKLPMAIIITTKHSSQGIGLGDIFLPGLLMMVAFREHREFHIPAFPLMTFVGIVIGMIFSAIALQIAQSPQPAMVYVLPTTMLAFVLFAWKKGILHRIWTS